MTSYKQDSSTVRGKGQVRKVPRGAAEQREWLRQQRAPAYARVADQCCDLLVKWYGPGRGAQIRYAEVLEVCEYGAPLTEDRIPVLLPFFSETA